MTNKERIKVISEALPEAIEKLKSLDIDGLKKLDPEDLEILENLIVFIDDIS